MTELTWAGKDSRRRIIQELRRCVPVSEDVEGLVASWRSSSRSGASVPSWAWWKVVWNDAPSSGLWFGWVPGGGTPLSVFREIHLLDVIDVLGLPSREATFLGERGKALRQAGPSVPMLEWLWPEPPVGENERSPLDRMAESYGTDVALRLSEFLRKRDEGTCAGRDAALTYIELIRQASETRGLDDRMRFAAVRAAVVSGNQSTADEVSRWVLGDDCPDWLMLIAATPPEGSPVEFISTTIEHVILRAPSPEEAQDRLEAFLGGSLDRSFEVLRATRRRRANRTPDTLSLDWGEARPPNDFRHSDGPAIRCLAAIACATDQGDLEHVALCNRALSLLLPLLIRKEQVSLAAGVAAHLADAVAASTHDFDGDDDRGERFSLARRLWLAAGALGAADRAQSVVSPNDGPASEALSYLPPDFWSSSKTLSLDATRQMLNEHFAVAERSSPERVREKGRASLRSLVPTFDGSCLDDDEIAYEFGRQLDDPIRVGTAQSRAILLEGCFNRIMGTQRSDFRKFEDALSERDETALGRRMREAWPDIGDRRRLRGLLKDAGGSRNHLVHRDGGPPRSQDINFFLKPEGDGTKARCLGDLLRLMVGGERRLHPTTSGGR